MRKIEIIAECCVNHNGDMRLAAQMIRRAKELGADVAKFQLFNAERLIEEINPTLPEINKKWVKRTELAKDDLVFLSDVCKKYDIEFMSSVFEEDLVEWLEEVNVKRYKIPKFLSTNERLLQRVFSTNKEVIISGIRNRWDKTKFLYCVSNYPTELKDVWLHPDMFDVDYDGFSDHTLGLAAPIAAMALGAKIVEKHFTLDRQMEGPDHACSVDPMGLGQLCKFRDDLETILYKLYKR